LVQRTASRNDWISLSEASRVLGVSPATVRRWSDAGRLRVFTTPGGHRRFSRSALERLLPADRLRRPPVTADGMSASRMQRAYRRVQIEAAPDLDWLRSLTDEQRQIFRERGQTMAATLFAFLDASESEDARLHLEEAEAAAEGQGAASAALGLSLSQTVEAFLRFREPFHRELGATARRRGFDTAETTDLMVAAEGVMDKMLVATMRGHGEAGAG
jgi:excisionase family DNA binding protein